MPENLISYAIFVSLVGLLFSAGLALIKNSFKASSVVLFVSTFVGFLSSAVYLANFSGKEIVMADFSALFGTTLRLNYLSGLFLALVAGVSSLTAIFGSEYLERYRKTYDLRMVQFLTSLFILGMMGVLLAGNAILFMLFWEMMSVASFFLVMSDKTEESVRAAFIYFIMTHLGAAAILGGFLILGGGSLAFDFGNIAEAQKNISGTASVLAFLLFLFGFGSKAGLIPFHIWLPVAHPQAPTNISALMSGLMLKIAVYGFLMAVLPFSGLPLWTSILVIALGISSAFFGALYAAIARDIKRALAYSSIENMGIIFTMLGTALFAGAKIGSNSVLVSLLAAFAIFHALNHGIFKSGLFLSSGVIVSKFHSRSLEAMGGLAKIMPFFSFVFLIIILSAAALPPFGAFFGEWGFIRALVGLLGEAGSGASFLVVVLAVLALFSLSSGLAIFAMIKIFGISMLGLPRTEIHDSSENGSDGWMVYPIAILGMAMVLSGIFAKKILDALSRNIQAWSEPSSGAVQNLAISSSKVFGISAAFLILSFGLYKLFSRNEGRSREYHTWDCGQPIDQSMEYTATAFSAPIRFFLLSLLQRSKAIVSVPIVASNPWIVKKSFALALTSIWQEKFYKPGLKFVFWLADKIRLIHTGRIQYYLLLLLATIVITLMIAI